MEYQSEGILERINEPPWGRCLQGPLMHAGLLLFVVVVVVAPQGGHFGLIVLRHTASLFVTLSFANIATELSFGPAGTKFRCRY